MKAPEWIARKVSILLPHSASVQGSRAKLPKTPQARLVALVPTPPVAKAPMPLAPPVKLRTASLGAARSTHERLAAMLRHGEEAPCPLECCGERSTRSKRLSTRASAR